MLEAIQRGIERALLDQQALLRDLLDAEQDAVAVQRSQRNGLEDEKVERALQQLGRVTYAALLDRSGEHDAFLLDRQGEPDSRAATHAREGALAVDLEVERCHVAAERLLMSVRLRAGPKPDLVAGTNLDADVGKAVAAAGVQPSTAPPSSRRTASTTTQVETPCADRRDGAPATTGHRAPRSARTRVPATPRRRRWPGSGLVRFREDPAGRG
jgi:hypothetical protein